MRYLITVEDARAVVRVNFSTCVFHIIFHNVQYCYCKKLYNAEKRNLVNEQLKAQIRRQYNTHVTQKRNAKVVKKLQQNLDIMFIKKNCLCNVYKEKSMYQNRQCLVLALLFLAFLLKLQQNLDIMFVKKSCLCNVYQEKSMYRSRQCLVLPLLFLAFLLKLQQNLDIMFIKKSY